MKRLYLAAAAVACLSACASVTDQKPLTTLAQARAAYVSTCGEVLRLRDAGLDLPSARTSCVTAADALNVADAAYQAGQLAQATSGATRALVLITAAQAVVAASGKVK